MEKWLLPGGAIASEVTGSACHKAARGNPLWYIVTGIGLVVAFAIFGEPLTGTMILGMALIALGVLTIELGSQHAARHRADA